MTVIYAISLIYFNHAIKLNNCFPRGIRYLYDDILVEMKVKEIMINNIVQLFYIFNY